MLYYTLLDIMKYNYILFANIIIVNFIPPFKINLFLIVL